MNFGVYGTPFYQLCHYFHLADAGLISILTSFEINLNSPNALLAVMQQEIPYFIFIRCIFLIGV